MIENSADFLPIRMILSAAFGFIVGDAFGDSTRHRKCLQQINNDLRGELDNPTNTKRRYTGPQATTRDPQRHPQADDSCDKRHHQVQIFAAISIS
jgi:hypothetical protein